MHRFLILIFSAALLTVARVPAKDATAEDYQKKVEAADPVKNPDKHKDLAAWCRRNFPQKTVFHQQAFHLYQFSLVEKALPATPTASALLEVAKKAEEWELEDQARDYRDRWGSLQFTAYEAKIKGNDPAMMKKLLTWAETEGVATTGACKAMCLRLLAAEPEYTPARKACGHFKFDGAWTDFDTALQKTDLKSPASRMKLHKAISESTPPPNPKDFPTDPFKGWTKNDGYWSATTKTTGAPYLVWATGYSRNTPSPLVIDLHGGGYGGLEKSIQGATTAIDMWTHSNLKGSYVVLAPAALNHTNDSWRRKNNFDDILEAIATLRGRFNIDMTRIYVTGQSMGGGGSAGWMWYFPELAAASCGRAGYYWTIDIPTDVLKKPIMIIHGAKDTDTRNGTLAKWLDITRGIGGNVEYISLPNVDHYVPDSEIMPRIIPFFEKYRSECAPDMRVIAAVAERSLKK